MRFLVVVASAVLLLAFVNAQKPDNDDDAKFNEFKRRHKKKYANSNHHSASFKRWKARRTAIDRHNRDAADGKFSFRMTDNEFADNTEDEWKRSLLGISVNGSSPLDQPLEQAVNAELENSINRQSIPPSLDLRTHPCMPPVKLQSPCGSCWAFIATTSVEFQTCARNNATVAPILSEQQLIDCSGAFGTKGCNGGFYSQAWDYLFSAGGQSLNTSYPYTATLGSCKFTANVTQGPGRITRYTYLPKNETSIMQALQRGPVTVSIVTNQRFILYSSGIFDDDTCRNGTVNHGVVLVGYGTVNQTDFWIARNSWGTAWGQAGHILMRRNVNICRISEYAFLAV